MTNSTEERMLEVLKQTVTVDSISRDTEIEALGLDSLDVTEFVMELEEEFDITVNDSAVEKWKTWGDVVSYVEEKI